MNFPAKAELVKMVKNTHLEPVRKDGRQPASGFNFTDHADGTLRALPLMVSAVLVSIPTWDNEVHSVQPVRLCLSARNNRPCDDREGHKNAPAATKTAPCQSRQEGKGVYLYNGGFSARLYGLRRDASASVRQALSPWCRRKQSFRSREVI